MLINCRECGGKATITKRQNQSTDVADLYCSCRNSECGHTFVATLSYKHSLSPGAASAEKMLVDLLRSKSPQEQMELINRASH